MNQDILEQWMVQIASRFHRFSYWQVERVALIGLGALSARSCRHSEIAERLREAEVVTADDKSTTRRIRRTIEDEKFVMSHFFRSWIAWVYDALDMDLKKRITLAVDETQVGPHHRAMVGSLVFEGCAIPLVWRVYRQNSAKDYPSERQALMIGRMLALVRWSIPISQPVVVEVDRGLGNSPFLCKIVRDLMWDFLFRIPMNTKIDTEEGRICPIEHAEQGKPWQAFGKVFVTRGRIDAYVKVLWDEGHAQPWILTTNSAELDPREYAKRNWTEQAFRKWKSSGFRLRDCRVRGAKKISRMLAILVLAQALAVSLGCIAAKLGKASQLIRRKNGQLRRQISLFLEGRSYLIRLSCAGLPLPMLQFHFDARWPP